MCVQCGAGSWRRGRVDVLLHHPQALCHLVGESGLVQKTFFWCLGDKLQEPSRCFKKATTHTQPSWLRARSGQAAEHVAVVEDPGRL